MNVLRDTPLQILIVEDEPGDLGLIQIHLRQAGYAQQEGAHEPLRRAASLAEARVQAAASPPDLVLLDLNLPDSSGLDTVTAMRGMLPGVPIIVMSGNQDVNVAVSALQKGAQDYLVKGKYEPAELGKAIRQALERSRLESRLRLLETALGASANAIVITDVDAHIEWANPAFTQLTGYTLDESIGHKPNELIKSGKQDQPFYQSMWETILSGSTWKGEIVNRRKNGELYHEDLTISPVQDNRGNIAHFIAVKQDISLRKKTEENLHAVNRLLDSIIDNIPDMIFMKDAQELRFVLLNQAGEKLLGHSRDDLLGRNDYDFFPKQQADSFTSRDREVLAHDKSVNIAEEPIATPAGTRILHTKKIAIRDDLGNPVHLLGISEDITERKEAEERLARSEANLRALLDNVPYLIWLKDTDCRFIAVNEAFFKTTGRASPDEVLGKTDFDLWPEELAQKYRADDIEVMEKRIQKLTEERSMDNGIVSWVETFKAPILDRNGKLLGTTGFARDITERKRAQELVQHMAHYDTLTELPNRALFSDRLQQALSAARRDKSHLALMFIDLDKFKPVNDELGHHVGDLLLKEVAKRMQACIRESDTVARIGGDEFVVLLPFIEEAQDALLVAEKIRHALNQPFTLAGRNLNISSSTGVSIYPEHGKNDTQLMKNADVAMYHAKEGGRNSVVLYRSDMRDA